MKYMRHLAFSCLFIGMLIFGIVYAQASGKQRSVATHTVVTPTQQDAVPKYYKAFVQYIAQPGSIIVDIRSFKGSIDYTDYEKWQLYYYNDYIWSTSCSCYTLDQTFGPSSFAFNTVFPSSWSAYSQNNTLNASAGLVTAKFAHKFSVYHDGWWSYSPTLYFFLNSE